MVCTSAKTKVRWGGELSVKQSVPYKQAKSFPSHSSTIAQFQNQTTPTEKQRQKLTIGTYIFVNKKQFPN